VDEPVCVRNVTIRNTQGLHARPADLFVKTAMAFTARVQVIKDNQRVDGRSILDLLTLAAVQGTMLGIEARGADAQEAVAALAELVEQGFHE
jgi:phosphotransferase system HPr (HPr) family protein